MWNKLFVTVFLPILLCLQSFASEVPPDTVKAGIYITSIHDIDFREKEYSVNLWLWLKYKRQDFNIVKNLEVPMAKSFQKEFAFIDTLPDSSIYALVKLQCLMRGIWKINNFPFDSQILRFGFESSEHDASQLVFEHDISGKFYGKYLLRGWEIDTFGIRTDTRKYETAFGDPQLTEAKSEYSAFRIRIVMHREPWELFMKLFLGMYISFLISLVCFFVPPENMDARLALSVGSLFAVIGNKYIVDSSLPESTSFTLVDILHWITLLFIFIIIVSSVKSLRLVKETNIEQARKFNRLSSKVVIAVYIILNIFVVYSATQSTAFDSESRNNGNVKAIVK
jgi:hypothetical protein